MFLPYIAKGGGGGGMLIMQPWPTEQIAEPHIVRMLHMKFTEIGLVVSDEKLFEIVDKHSIIVWSWPLVFTEVHEAPSFISRSTIVLEEKNVAPFLHSKTKGTKYDLDEK